MESRKKINLAVIEAKIPVNEAVPTEGSVAAFICRPNTKKKIVVVSLIKHYSSL